MKIAKSAWAALIPILVALIWALLAWVLRIFDEGRFYPRIPIRAYDRGVLNEHSSVNSKEFRVSPLAYFLVAIFTLPVGIIDLGIATWVHLHSVYWLVVAPAALTILAISLVTGLFTGSRVTITDLLLEYAFWQKKVQLDLSEIESVTIQTKRLQGYILVTTKGRDPLKLPLFFRGGPQLYRMLKARAHSSCNPPKIIVPLSIVLWVKRSWRRLLVPITENFR